MTVTEAEKQRILYEYEQKKKKELSERMAKLGRTRSAKKRKAALRNVKIAQAARFGRPLPKGVK
jgi:hypothetical protein